VIRVEASRALRVSPDASDCEGPKVSITKEDQFEAIRVQLEERYEFHTGQLRGLIAEADEPRVADALGSRSRQALSDIAGALRLMAEGSYGRCLDCQNDIPMERLEVRPDALLCADCQQKQERYRFGRTPTV
jgi:DnaK suppressor protein